MPQHIEINPAQHLTIGTVGLPGERVFYLQGGRGEEHVSLILEKMQAVAIVESLEQLFKELQKRLPSMEQRFQEEVVLDMRLRQPIEPIFRVGNLGVGYNGELELVVLVAYEMVEESAEPNLVSFWVPPHHAKYFVEHTRQVIKGGRPICGNCGQPIDAEGHFCPHRNGYMG